MNSSANFAFGRQEVTLNLRVIEDMLNKGYTIRYIHTYLVEREAVTIGYNQFWKHLRNMKLEPVMICNAMVFKKSQKSAIPLLIAKAGKKRRSDDRFSPKPEPIPFKDDAGSSSESPAITFPVKASAPVVTKASGDGAPRVIHPAPPVPVEESPGMVEGYGGKLSGKQSSQQEGVFRRFKRKNDDMIKRVRDQEDELEALEHVDDVIVTIADAEISTQ